VDVERHSENLAAAKRIGEGVGKEAVEPLLIGVGPLRPSFALRDHMLGPGPFPLARHSATTRPLKVVPCCHQSGTQQHNEASALPTPVIQRRHSLLLSTHTSQNPTPIDQTSPTGFYQPPTSFAGPIALLTAHRGLFARWPILSVPVFCYRAPPWHGLRNRRSPKLLSASPLPLVNFLEL